jgi:NAD(P)-dependent dehydrogenase (short-subunit alcohol dehydrogenase family)
VSSDGVGKCALVTGSSRGIGRGIALNVAEQGVKLAIHYHGNEAAANDTLDGIRKCESDGLVVQADVSRPEDVRRLFQEVEDHFGGLDIFASTPVLSCPPSTSRHWRSPSIAGGWRATRRLRPSSLAHKSHAA